MWVLSILLFYVIGNFTVCFAAVTSARARTLVRYKEQCDSGIGKSCYDYGRALWSTPGAIDRKTAKIYLLRGCELKYSLACEAYKDHNVSTRINKHRSLVSRNTASRQRVCFSTEEMKKARLSLNTNNSSGHFGQKIDQVKLHSFWSRVGLLENDVILRVNNLPFNSSQEALQALGSSGKKFAFEVLRNGESITLWYTCK